MVAVSPNPIYGEKVSTDIDLPLIDLSAERSEVAKLIVKACQDYGFFKVINHGVSNDLITYLEEESFKFFSKSQSEKQAAGPANPFGYGCRTIGFNGDVGEVEYLLFNTNPLSISQMSKTLSNDPIKFSSSLSGYIEGVRGVACEILDLIGEGLWVPDTQVLSRLIRDVDSDSVLRLNHYPPVTKLCRDSDTSPSKVGFGEHSDPQILTLLRSNDVGGLQISTLDGLWLPVPPDPTAFCVNVGDALQAMTNGRFVSVRHRAMTNTRSDKARLSMAYFGAPSLNQRISALPEVVETQAERLSLYRPFTWAEYKKSTYSLRLGDTRLSLFKTESLNPL